MKKKHFNIKIFLLLFFGMGMIFSAILFFSWLKENKTVKNIVEKEIIRIKKHEDNIHLDQEIMKDNSETIAWLTVNGTSINYPVVQHTDNQYYLTHDYNQNDNSAGWIFMDYRNQLDDQNIVIYGHHRRDKSMFGSIDNLYNQKGDKDLNISFITINGKATYKIFSIYKINKKDYYTDRKFDNFEETIKFFQERSEINFRQNIENATQIITLSTCNNNNIDRIVVHGCK